MSGTVAERPKPGGADEGIAWAPRPDTWGVVSKTFHWVVAAIVVSMIAIGFYMHDLPFGAEKAELYQLHKSFGVLVFFLVAARLAWRLSQPVPPPPAGMAPWQRAAANATHYGFYALLLAQPIVGWLVVSASPLRVPTNVFGLFELPHLFAEGDEALYGTFSEIHEILAFALAGLLAVHVAGALKHHFTDKDGVLQRMLPGRAKRPI